MHGQAAQDHRHSLSFEPRNPGCLAAFKECLEALLTQDDLTKEERQKASKDLADICTLGRISDESLAFTQNSQIVEQMSTSTSTTQQDTIEKKKRSANGY